MANILPNLNDWSNTPASNQPDGADTASFKDDLQQLQATVRKDLALKGSSIASSATVDLSTATGNFIDITGTTTITSFGTMSAGMWKVLRFTGICTITYNATSMILPSGADITTANGDMAIIESLGSGNWQIVSYQKIDGRALVASAGAPFVDSTPLLKGSADQTKQVAFEVDGLATATTRTLTVKDKNYTIAADDEVVHNTGNETIAGIKTFSTTPVFPRYVSPPQTITTAGLLTLAHGLGATPYKIYLSAKCISAENDYSVGDEVTITNSSTSSTGGFGLALLTDATNITIRFGSAATGVLLANHKTTGGSFGLTNTKWQLYVRAEL